MVSSSSTIAAAPGTSSAMVGLPGPVVVHALRLLYPEREIALGRMGTTKVRARRSPVAVWAIAIGVVVSRGRARALEASIVVIVATPIVASRRRAWRRWSILRSLVAAASATASPIVVRGAIAAHRARDLVGRWLVDEVDSMMQALTSRSAGENCWKLCRRENKSSQNGRSADPYGAYPGSQDTSRVPGCVRRPNLHHRDC